MNDTFNIKEFKRKGLENYKRDFWFVTIATAILIVLGAQYNGTQVNGGFTYKFDNQSQNVNFLQNENASVQTIIMYLLCILLLAFILGIMIVAIILCVGSFVCAPLGVGMKNMYMKLRHDKAEVNDIMKPFLNGSYMKVVKTMFFCNLKLWLWSFLFYIPGIIKYYQYYFVPYIVASNPDLDKDRAYEICTMMTGGRKADIFWFDLTFIGWFFLVLAIAVMTCGLGVLLYIPLICYVESARAEMYTERREYVIIHGGVSEAELPM